MNFSTSVKPTDDLLRFSVRRSIVEHPVYQAAMDRVERLHRRSLASGQPGGLLITGLSGSGKTTIKTEYESRFPKADDGAATRIRVLGIDTPPAPTVKNFAESILIAMEDPMSHKGSAEQKTNRIYDLCKRCGVELLLIDEFQHFLANGRRNEASQVTDWLKSLINRVGIPVVLFGLPECEHLLQLNVQLARRFSARYFLRPFGFASDLEKAEFQGVLNAIESLLPLPSVSLSSPEMAQRFYYATCGLIDYICKITDGAVQIAYEQKCKTLDCYLYAAAFEEEVWREATPELNPFSATDQLRPLISPGEPFANIVAPARVVRKQRSVSRSVVN